jgi:hypothetical protein
MSPKKSIRILRVRNCDNGESLPGTCCEAKTFYFGKEVK